MSKRLHGVWLLAGLNHKEKDLQRKPTCIVIGKMGWVFESHLVQPVT